MSGSTLRDAADSSIGELNSYSNTEEQQEEINKIIQWMNESQSSIGEINFRTISEEDYRFYAGKQDTPEVLAELARQLRPANTYNTILPKINMLCGLAAQGSRVPFIFPVKDTDEALTELMNNAFKHFRWETKATRKENECFEHAVKSGRSFLGFYIGGDDPFKPEILMKRVSGRDVLLDPLSVEYDMSDARYIIISKWFTKEQLEALMPDIDISSLATSDWTSNYQPLFYNSVSDKYRIAECWYRKYIEYSWFQNPLTGKPDKLPSSDFPKFIKTLKNGIPLPNGELFRYTDKIPVIKRIAKKVYFMIFSGNQVIDSGISPYKHDYFPYVQFGAYKDEEENRWFSVISMMKDPQKGKNAMRRQLQHLLNTSPKGILVHEVGAIINEDEYKQHSSEPNFRLILAQNKMDKYRFTDQPVISPVYAQLEAQFEQDEKDCSGIQDSLLGIQTSSREPGITVRMRQETGIAVLHVLFQNFRESRLQCGKILLAMIQQYMNQEQMILIEGMAGNELAKINSQLNPQFEGYNDITAGKYGLVIDEASENTTMRMATAQMLTDYSQNNPGVIPPDIILEYSDIPMITRRKVQQYQQQMMAREDAFRKAELEQKDSSDQLKAKTKLIDTKISANSKEKIAFSEKESNTKGRKE